MRLFVAAPLAALCVTGAALITALYVAGLLVWGVGTYACVTSVRSWLALTVLLSGVRR